jgi:hypothetical protein
VDLHSSFNIHLQSPESSFDLLNDRISFFGLGLDNSLSGMGMESSLLGRDIGAEASIGGVTLGDFDVKDEEVRMKAFLRISTGWEDEGTPLNGTDGVGDSDICKMLLDLLCNCQKLIFTIFSSSKAKTGKFICLRRRSCSRINQHQ